MVKTPHPGLISPLRPRSLRLLGHEPSTEWPRRGLGREQTFTKWPEYLPSLASQNVRSLPTRRLPAARARLLGPRGRSPFVLAALTPRGAGWPPANHQTEPTRLSVRLPAAPVFSPAAPVREPAAPVFLTAAPVREPVAPVFLTAAPVREPVAPVFLTAAPVREPAVAVRPAPAGRRCVRARARWAAIPAGDEDLGSPRGRASPKGKAPLAKREESFA